MIKARKRRSDSVFLSHFEVLSEVLISTPPVSPDHAQSLVSPDLVEVGVSNVVLLSVNRESSVSVRSPIHFVYFSQSVSPVLNHSFLLYFKLVMK